MKILGYLPGASSAKYALLRASRLLHIELDQAHTERQVIRLTERACDAGEKVLIVTTDEEISLIRELQARTPSCRVLLLSGKKFVRLPYFLTSSQLIDGYFMSNSHNCGADFFISFLGQQCSKDPFSMDRYLGHTIEKCTFEISHLTEKQGLLQQTKDFYEWCVGDINDQGHVDTVRQLQDSLDELVSNALRHGPATTDHVKQPLVELAFDGVHVGTRVIDYHGSLSRKTILQTLATDHAALQRTNDLAGFKLTSSDSEPLPTGGIGLKMILEKQQRVIFHLRENVSTEVLCLARLPKRFRDYQSLPTSLEIKIWDTAA